MDHYSMKIGILGCGYVGQAMALFWKQVGHRVAVTTRQPARVPFLQTLVDEVHLLEEHGLKHHLPSSFLAQQEILLICVAPDKASDYASTYFDTAKQVAEQTAQNPSLRHILYTSSTSVYGDHGGEWVDEDTPIVPNHANREILYQTERVLLGCSSQRLKICILRLGEIYGPGRNIEDRLRRMQHQPFAGSGASYTNLIHLTDILQALDFALQNQLQGIYNLCNDFHVPRREFYESLCKMENLPSVQWDPSLHHWHQGNKRVSNKKIKNDRFHFTHPSYFL